MQINSVNSKRFISLIFDEEPILTHIDQSLINSGQQNDIQMVSEPDELHFIRRKNYFVHTFLRKGVCKTLWRQPNNAVIFLYT